jgi:hypothetical protein
MRPTLRPEQRQDLHNPAVDEDTARRGACGEVHLPSGRTCTLAYGHPGSCDFVPRDRIPDELPAGPS